MLVSILVIDDWGIFENILSYFWGLYTEVAEPRKLTATTEYMSVDCAKINLYAYTFAMRIWWNPFRPRDLCKSLCILLKYLRMDSKLNHTVQNTQWKVTFSKYNNNARLIWTQTLVSLSLIYFPKFMYLLSIFTLGLSRRTNRPPTWL